MADGAVNADPGAAVGNKARLTLPNFKGENDALATRNFCHKVDGYMLVTRLTEEETAQAVAFAMTAGSVADLWLQNLTESDPDSVGTWDRLRPLIIGRFSPTLTPSERAAALEGCRQGKNEDVKAYMDKCESVQIMVEREIPRANRVGNFAASFLETHQKAVLDLFLRGLREETGLKSNVNGALNCVTLAHYLEAAVRYERHVSKGIKVTVAEVAEDDDGGEEEDDGDEIAALKSKQGTKKRTSGQTGRGGGYAGGNGRGKNSGAGGSGGRPGPRCWSCRSPDHLNNVCPNKKKWGAGGRGGGGQGKHGRGGGYGGGNSSYGGYGGSSGHGGSGNNQAQGIIMQLLAKGLQGQGNPKEYDVNNVDCVATSHHQAQGYGQPDFW